MGGHKREDHVFNHGLKQTFPELVALVRQVLALDPRLDACQGAAQRAERLIAALTGFGIGVETPPFALTVDKPGKTPGGDANSQIFGEAKRQLVYTFRQFLEAQKGWELAAGEGRERQARMLHTACLHLKLEFGRWLDSAIDAEAEAQAKREDPKNTKLIADGRAHLVQLRKDLIEMLHYFAPASLKEMPR